MPKGLMRACQILFAVATFSIGAGAQAQTCDTYYEVGPGDSLFKIAETLYKDENKWPVIFYTNQDVLGASPSLIRAGTRIYLPCLSRDKRRADSRSERLTEPPANVELRLLTGDNYPPFTDRGLDGMGMFTELVTTALSRYPDAPSFGVFWVNRWATHLTPLLSTTAFDMGFPWFKPDCNLRAILRPDDASRCDFLFSDRIQSIPVKLFVRMDDPAGYEEDGDIVGRRLCRPNGYYTFDLDQYGRRWLIDGRIALERPETPQECFTMLLNGRVDAVALAALVGQKTIAQMGLSDKVKEIEKELSTEGLHVLIHKTHPHAQEYIELINNSISLLKESGEFRQISMRHITSPETVVDIWGGVD